MGMAKTFGPTSLPTITSVGCVRDGNEPHLLGHKSLHLSSGTERRVFSDHQGAADQDADAWRSIAHLYNHPGRSIGQADTGGRHPTLPKIPAGHFIACHPHTLPHPSGKALHAPKTQ